MDEQIHKHWRFVAFDAFDESINMMQWAVTITVDGYTTEDEALVAARSIVTRKYYRLQAVWECSTCKLQTRLIESLEQR